MITVDSTKIRQFHKIKRSPKSFKSAIKWFEFCTAGFTRKSDDYQGLPKGGPFVLLAFSHF